MKKVFGILLLTVLVLTACKKDPKPGNLKINMKHVVANEDFELNDVKYSSPAGHTYGFTTYQYYVSEFHLVSKDGGSQLTDKGFLIDVEKEASMSFMLNEVPPGTYNKLRFQYGFSKSRNVEDYLESTVDNQNMLWPEPLGPGAYHYMKLEGSYDSLNTGKLKPYIMHSGPTMGADNSFTVELDIAEFVIDDNAVDFNINLDMKEWIQNPTVYDFKDWSMVMMNQNAQDIYKTNGQNVFSSGELLIDEE